MTSPTDPSHVKFVATAPSNIAFVKYWGKRDAKQQWPANDSISMTLSASTTETMACRSSELFDSFTFGGQTITSATTPNHKVFSQIERIRQTLNIQGHLSIASKNSFPTGCGIASSASGFAALTIASAAALTGCATWEELELFGVSRERIASLARQGSGSAGRSLYGGYVRWSRGSSAEEQSIRPIFAPGQWALADVIVIFSDHEKHVSSTEAHKAAWGSPLFEPRLAGLSERLHLVSEAIESRHLSNLGAAIEADALEMHAVAMTGAPAVNYFTPETTQFISWVRSERTSGRLPAWFTIDAGPNVHLICDPKQLQTVTNRIKKEWPQAKLIVDQTGTGPTLHKVTKSSGAHHD